DAVAREPHLRRRRELLANAAHRLRRGAARDLAAVAEDDVARTPLREVVRDAGAYRAGAGDDDSSHRSSSARSVSVSRRSGARTSSRTGTPRRASTALRAAWRGNRSIAR